MAEDINVPAGFQLDNDAVGNVPAGYQLDQPQDEGALMAAGRGALRNFPLAQQAVAGLEPGQYSQNIKDLTSKAESAKATHPIAYGAGAVAGTVAPMALPGVGEGLEAAPVIGNALLGAAQSQSDTDLTKFNTQNAKDAAISGAIGGGLGFAGQGVRAVAPSAEEMAASSTAKGLGTTARNIGKVMGDNPNVRMGQIGNWINDLTTEEGEPISTLATRPAKLLTAIEGVHDDAGEQIGDIIDQIAPHATVDGKTLVKSLAPIAEDLNIINPQSEAKVLNVIKKINELDDAGKLNFSQLQKLKSVVGKSMGDDPNMEQAYGVFADYMNNVIESYGHYLDNPQLKNLYDSAKLDYKNSSQILPILKRAAGKEMSEGPIGNSGLLGLFGLASGVASGHPVGGAAAALGSAIGRPIANMVGKNMALKSVPYAPAIAATGRGLNKAAIAELTNFLSDKFKNGGR